MESMFDEEDYLMVRCSVEILLNKGCLTARKYLVDKRSKSSLLHSASSFIEFLSSLLSLDEAHINETIDSLKETQRYCTMQSNHLRKEKCSSDDLRLLMNEIFCTDTELYMAILTILKQGLKDYVKGAFLIRKSWKQYKKSYEKIIKIGGSFLKVSAESNNQNEALSQSESFSTTAEETKTCNSSNGNSSEIVNSQALYEVQAAIAFGYGLFNLVVSLTPPKVLQLAQMLGFHGNQGLGLVCLKYVCQSQNVKAELSRLGLLWYHAIVRPMYSFDDNDVKCGLKEASQLLQGLQEHLLLSPVALYFEGLIFRCKGNFSEATRSLSMALEKPLAHKEMMVFCDYEIGWCHLLEMRWDLAIEAFIRVKDAAIWSQCFYVYLIGVLHGVQGNTSEAVIYLRYVPSLVKRKTPLSVFLIRKASSCIQTPPNNTESLVLLLEIIYLWECLPTCSLATLSCLLEGLEKPVDDRFVALKLFLTAYIMRRLERLSEAIEFYKEAVNANVTLVGDKHISPFASFELGLISAQLSQFDKGLEFLRKAKDTYSSYDFENRLKLKIDIATKKIQERANKE
ncbi:tetratricopeptide repeat protein 39C-like [Dendronephthya gigantea]|uniref:tetratricopeptide repeat protein 39C-like n=1 Tax=Dendronephthya gigantea TaxID=151771 RepID=UPI00106CDD96|nr:tetratricopeptide repeat protein 39C-like [Dendronephthya gigantea]